MTALPLEQSLLQEEFEGRGLEPQRWAPLQVQLEDGTLWVAEEPGAHVAVEGGVLSLSVHPFTRSHPRSQFLDNAKHLLVSRQSLPVPARGMWVLEAEIGGERHGESGGDWASGSAGLILLSASGGLAAAWLTTGRVVGALSERFALHPSAPEPHQSELLPAPQPAAPDQFHRVALIYEQDRDRLSWWLEGQLLHVESRVPVKVTAWQVGLGLLTHLPLKEGRSTSLLGQGMTGRWRHLKVSTLE